MDDIQSKVLGVLKRHKENEKFPGVSEQELVHKMRVLERRRAKNKRARRTRKINRAK